MDGYLPSGESMCRQLLYGQTYFLQQFGIKCTEVKVITFTKRLKKKCLQTLLVSAFDFIITFTGVNINQLDSAFSSNIKMCVGQQITHLWVTGWACLIKNITDAR